MVKYKVLLPVIFVIVAFSIMFFDAQFYLEQRSRPSMALVHAVHGEDQEMGEAGNDHSMTDPNSPMTGPEEYNPTEEEHDEQHATAENIAECFGHHGDSYEESLEHCQEDICGANIHCFEEVAELSAQYKG